MAGNSEITFYLKVLLPIYINVGSSIRKFKYYI